MRLIVSVLTACPVATGMRTSLPVTGAHSARLTSSPQIRRSDCELSVRVAFRALS